jgi:hypothetical protein
MYKTRKQTKICKNTSRVIRKRQKEANNNDTTYCTKSTYSYINKINDNTHISSMIFTAIQFSSLHYTTHHSPFFTSLHFGTFHHHPSKPLLFTSLVITFLPLFPEICDLQWKVASDSAGS